LVVFWGLFCVHFCRKLFCINFRCNVW
jgi:hypothetical protein